MAFTQSSTILTMLLLAIVATTCLASYDASWQRADNSLRRRGYNNEIYKSLNLKQRGVSCPGAYRSLGDDDCVCSYAIDFSHADGIISGPPTDGFNAVGASGNCGSGCPDGFRFLSASYINAPFTFTYGQDGVVLGARVCKAGGK